MSVYTEQIRLAIESLSMKKLQNLAYHMKQRTRVLTGEMAEYYYYYGGG